MSALPFSADEASTIQGADTAGVGTMDATTVLRSALAFTTLGAAKIGLKHSIPNLIRDSLQNGLS